MTYDYWKTMSDLDAEPWRNEPEPEDDDFEPEERLSECDCCGEMKYGCVDLWYPPVGDTHACPACRGEEEE